MPLLSILIASTPERENLLRNLLLELNIQIVKAQQTEPEKKGIELVVDDSMRFLSGGLSIGMKREALKNRATGDYMCYLDVDEGISPNYIETLLKLCLEGKDVCTFRAMVKLEDSWGLVDMQLKYLMNDQYTPEHDIRRRPWHICPIRTRLAQMYHFEDISNGEDYKFTEQVLAHCSTEAHTDKIIFEYRHGKHSEADEIENAKI